MTRTAFDPARHRVASRRTRERTAVLSIDVEHDYNGAGAHALERLPDLLGRVRGAGLPLTAFVEGRLFESRPDLCARLIEAGADVQLHCYDHREAGDTAADLERGVDRFERFTGRRPRGYRAHTYRLTEEIFRTLVAQGFAWDSSILPGVGLGGQRGGAFRGGDWFVLDGALAEFPVACWRPFGIPFTHSYRRLLGRTAERLLDRAASLPPLLIYNMHMVDLVPDGRLAGARLPLWLRCTYALARRSRLGFDDVAALGARLAARGYEWRTLSDCHQRLTGRGRA